MEKEKNFVFVLDLWSGYQPFYEFITLLYFIDLITRGH